MYSSSSWASMFHQNILLSIKPNDNGAFAEPSFIKVVCLQSANQSHPFVRCFSLELHDIANGIAPVITPINWFMLRWRRKAISTFRRRRRIGDAVCPFPLVFFFDFVGVFIVLVFIPFGGHDGRVNKLHVAWIPGIYNSAARQFLRCHRDGDETVQISGGRNFKKGPCLSAKFLIVPLHVLSHSIFITENTKSLYLISLFTLFFRLLLTISKTRGAIPLIWFRIKFPEIEPSSFRDMLPLIWPNRFLWSVGWLPISVALSMSRPRNRHAPILRL